MLESILLYSVLLITLLIVVGLPILLALYVLYLKKSKKINDLLIVTDVKELRDPFIVPVGDVYYMYGTGWLCYKNTNDCLAGPWQPLGRVAEVPADAARDLWAPEVHRYNNAYYMFTTYRSKTTDKHGCVILKSDNPEGPFKMISNGQITPSEWDSIDGTLHVDQNGQPWLVFVHEWISTDDGVGRMAAAKMSDDLTRLIDEPIELFRADDPEWKASYVTDGPFLYRCKDGSLLMLWSNFINHKYCLAVAKSANGKIDGEWQQMPKPLYSAQLGLLEGGHGMLFSAKNGKMYASFHSPNHEKHGRRETPVFLPVTEKNGNLIVNAEK